MQPSAGMLFLPPPLVHFQMPFTEYIPDNPDEIAPLGVADVFPWGTYILTSSISQSAEFQEGWSGQPYNLSDTL